MPDGNQEMRGPLQPEKTSAEKLSSVINVGGGVLFVLSRYLHATPDDINSLVDKAKSLLEQPSPSVVQKKVSGLPISEAYNDLVRPADQPQTEIRDYKKEAEELKALISIHDSDERIKWFKAKGIKPEDIEITITPHFGQVVAKEGLKVRLFPDTDPNIGIAADPKIYLQFGKYTSWLYELKMGNDRWAAYRVVIFKNEKGEVSQWFFYGVNVKGEEWVKEFKAPAPLR